MFTMFDRQKTMVLVMGLVVLGGCATAPAIQVPQTVKEISTLKAAGKQNLVKMPSFANCEALESVAADGGDYEKRLMNAKIRARCVQEQLVKKLTKVKSLEVGTRAALQTLALGASAAGLFGGGNDLIAALGLSAGATAGIRAFQPLETRDRLYFYAIGALECSIMTADTLARDGENGFAERVLNSLKDQPPESANDNCNRAFSNEIKPDQLAKQPDPATSVREILSKRMRLMSSGKAGSSGEAEKRDMYAPYLRADSSFMSLYTDNGQVGNKRSLDIMDGTVPAITSLRHANPAGGGKVDPTVAALLTTNVARIAMSSQQAVESFASWFRVTNDAVRHAPETLENATTLIALAVNKALVDEQPDVQALEDAAARANERIFATVKSNRGRFKVFEQAQEQQMETAVQTVKTLQASVQASVAKDAGEKDATQDVINETDKALEDIQMTKAILDGIVRLAEARSDQPAACRTLFNSVPEVAAVTPSGPAKS